MALNFITAAANACVLCRGVFYTDELTYAGIQVIGSSENEYLGYSQAFEYISKTEVFIYWKDSEQKPSRAHLRVCPLSLCTHRQHRHLAILFHGDCYKYLRLALRAKPNLASRFNVWNFGKSTLWTFLTDPAGQTKQHRITTLISAIATRIYLHGLSKNTAVTGEAERNPSTSNLYQLLHLLPLELLQIIVNLAWQCSFFTPVAVFQESCNFNYLNPSLSTSIDLVSSQYAYLGWTTYSNTRYISYFSNQRRALSDELISLTGETYQLKLAVDDRGIRHIYFLDSNKNQIPDRFSPKNRMMFQTLQAGDNMPVRRIESVTDSLFLRDIVIKGESSPMAFDASLEWDTPYTPALDPKNCFQAIESNHVPKRWSWLPLKKELRGLIGCYDAHGLLSLHAWYGENDFQWSIQAQSTCYEMALWLFFPMRPTELVSDLVVLQTSRFGQLSLAVKSTLGRSYTFGPYQPDQQSFCLNKNNREFVSGICFNKPQLNHRAITHVGITCKPFEFSEKYSALSSRHLDCPERLNRHKWFLSNASLEDIAKIQLCRDDRWPNQPYVGILITYKDESQTALGQWRWDASLEMIPFDDKFQFMHYKSRHNTIIGIEFHIESAITEVTWSKARLHGEIFWWFNRVSNSILEFQFL